MIEALQHIGIGVSDARRSFGFYKKVLGFTVKLNDHEAEMEEMLPVLGSVERMHIIMALNLLGGAAVELVQHTSSEPRPMPEGLRWGDIGCLACGVKAYAIEELVPVLERNGVRFETGLIEEETGRHGTWRSAFIRDPDGVLIELLETPELKKAGGRPRVGGFSHVTVGVSDMDRSLEFYTGVAGYDEVVLDTGETHPAMEKVTGGAACRTATLKRSRRSGSKLPLEEGMVRLVQSRDFKGEPIYEGRRWGDIGIMEFAADVLDVGGTYHELTGKGAEGYLDPVRIDMGSGSVGSVAYVKDPDGNIIELVEVEKLGFLPPGAVAPLLKAILKIRSRF